jgi:hypothetical protein
MCQNRFMVGGGGGRGPVNCIFIFDSDYFSLIV